MKTYKIRKWKWKAHIDGEYETHTPDCTMGDYIVRVSDGVVVKWSYCYDECDDDGGGIAETVEDAKRAAYEHWLERILPALEEVK